MLSIIVGWTEVKTDLKDGVRKKKDFEMTDHDITEEQAKSWMDLSDELEQELISIGESDDTTSDENLTRIRARNQAYIRFGEKVKEQVLQTPTVLDSRK